VEIEDVFDANKGILRIIIYQDINKKTYSKIFWSLYF
jgi:hypothetical protein